MSIPLINAIVFDKLQIDRRTYCWSMVARTVHTSVLANSKEARDMWGMIAKSNSSFPAVVMK